MPAPPTHSLNVPSYLAGNVWDIIHRRRCHAQQVSLDRLGIQRDQTAVESGLVTCEQQASFQAAAAPHSGDWLHARDGPQFGKRRSMAECSARFGSATCDYSAAELQQKFGVICSFAFTGVQHFALAADVNLNLKHEVTVLVSY